MREYRHKCARTVTDQHVIMSGCGNVLDTSDNPMEPSLYLKVLTAHKLLGIESHNDTKPNQGAGAGWVLNNVPDASLLQFPHVLIARNFVTKCKLCNLKAQVGQFKAVPGCIESLAQTSFHDNIVPRPVTRYPSLAISVALSQVLRVHRLSGYYTRSVRYVQYG